MAQIVPANIVLITPSDTVNLAIPVTHLRWDGLGDLVVDTIGGQTNITITGLLAGGTLDLQVQRVRATGTTVTNISGYY